MKLTEIQYSPQPIKILRQIKNQHHNLISDKFWYQMHNEVNQQSPWKLWKQINNQIGKPIKNLIRNPLLNDIGLIDLSNLEFNKGLYFLSKL
jgi:hypothetical protein